MAGWARPTIPARSFTYYEYSSALQGARFTESRLVNFDADSTFTSIDLAVTRRMADNWMMSASFSGTSKNNQNVAVLPADNPNADFNQSDENYEWISKLSGSYRFPYDIQASALFEVRSGEPWARTVLFSGGTTIPTLVMNVEPIGARSYANSHHLDVRVEKAFRLRGEPRAGRAVQRLQRAEQQHDVDGQHALGSHVRPAAHDPCAASGRDQRVVQVLRND